jgi:hypothetical protein
LAAQGESFEESKVKREGMIAEYVYDALAGKINPMPHNCHQDAPRSHPGLNTVFL